MLTRDSFEFSPEVRQQLLDALRPVGERVQPLIEAGNDQGLAEFAVRGALRVYRCAKEAGFGNTNSALALARSLYQLTVALSSKEDPLSPDDFGKNAANAFRLGGTGPQSAPFIPDRRLNGYYKRYRPCNICMQTGSVPSSFYLPRFPIHVPFFPQTFGLYSYH